MLLVLTSGAMALVIIRLFKRMTSFGETITAAFLKREVWSSFKHEKIRHEGYCLKSKLYASQLDKRITPSLYCHIAIWWVLPSSQPQALEPKHQKLKAWLRENDTDLIHRSPIATKTKLCKWTSVERRHKNFPFKHLPTFVIILHNEIKIASVKLHKNSPLILLLPQTSESWEKAIKKTSDPHWLQGTGNRVTSWPISNTLPPPQSKIFLFSSLSLPKNRS